MQYVSQVISVCKGYYRSILGVIIPNAVEELVTWVKLISELCVSKLRLFTLNFLNLEYQFRKKFLLMNILSFPLKQLIILILR